MQQYHMHNSNIKTHQLMFCARASNKHDGKHSSLFILNDCSDFKNSIISKLLVLLKGRASFKKSRLITFYLAQHPPKCTLLYEIQAVCTQYMCDIMRMWSRLHTDAITMPANILLCIDHIIIIWSQNTGVCQFRYGIQWMAIFLLQTYH